MTEDKSTPLRIVPSGPDAAAVYDASNEQFAVCYGGAPYERAALIVSAVNSHDAMKECVEALKRMMGTAELLYAKSPDVWTPIEMEAAYGNIKSARSARAKLEKADE